jgi:hypothetical protein
MPSEATGLVTETMEWLMGTGMNGTKKVWKVSRKVGLYCMGMVLPRLDKSDESVLQQPVASRRWEEVPIFSKVVL